MWTARRPPASSSWLTSSSSRETAWPPSTSPRAISRSAMRKDSTWSAIPWAKSTVCSSSVVRCRATVGVPVSSMHGSPSLEGPAQRHLVGVLQVATYGKSTRKPRDAQPQRLQEPGEIGRRGLTLEVGVHRQDHLGDLAVGEAGHQLADAQLVGPDV